MTTVASCKAVIGCQCMSAITVRLFWRYFSKVTPALTWTNLMLQYLQGAMRSPNDPKTDALLHTLMDDLDRQPIEGWNGMREIKAWAASGESVLRPAWASRMAWASFSAEISLSK